MGFGALAVMGLVNGSLTFIFRLIFHLFYWLPTAFQLDRSSEAKELNDSVFASFLALVQVTNEVQNPIFICATRLLSPHLEDTWQPRQPSHDQVEEDRQQERVRRLRVRNYFWLLVPLYRNQPCKYNNHVALQRWRAHRLKEDAEEPQIGTSP